MIDKTKGYLPYNTMRELIRDNSMLLPAISRFDIAFGFGDKPVAVVCRENNVDTNTFLCVCNLLSGYGVDLSDISLTSLMDYLKRAHSSFLDVSLPKIRLQLIEGINYSETNDVSLLLIKFFDDYVLEVKRHMEYENDVIFRYVERLQAGQSDDSFNIGSFSCNHKPMASKLNELKDIFIYHYKQKENARLSAALFDIIICERDLTAHFEVENRILLPVVERLECRVLSQQETDSQEEAGQEDDASQANLLSEREKDIVRGLAKGLSTKEIADRLCLSVHTVSTHRRNINAKLDIHSPAALVIFAILNHIVDIHDVK